MSLGDHVSAYDEERIGELLRRLPPPPEGWVRAAQELPFARRGIDQLVERARADTRFREALLADAETTLQAEGYEANDVVLHMLQDELEASDGDEGPAEGDEPGEDQA